MMLHFFGRGPEKKTNAISQEPLCWGLNLFLEVLEGISLIYPSPGNSHHPGLLTFFSTKIPNKKTILEGTLQGTNISPEKSICQDDFPFPQVGYVNFLGRYPFFYWKNASSVSWVKQYCKM